MPQLFDVTNPDGPKLPHKEVIGARGPTSDAATHHVVSSDLARRGLFGLPMVICEGGEGGQFGNEMRPR